MYLGIKSVKVLPDYLLLLTFENRERRIFDVKPLLSTGILSQLKDETLFHSVRIRFDTIEWSNGADLDPEMLYDKSRPEESAHMYTARCTRTAAISVREMGRKNAYRHIQKRK